MKKRPLTLVGAFLLLVVAILVTIGNFKKPEIKKVQNLKPQTSVVKKPKPRLDQKTKKIEQKPERGFRIVTSVSMYDPSSKTNLPEN